MSEDATIRTIPDDLAGQRLDQALARLFPEYSRSRLKSWLLDGAISVDGEQPRPRDPVLGGEVVRLTAEAEPVVLAEPEPIALDVVYEDDSLAVVNKPAGLVTHPGAGNPRGTLMNGLLHHAPALEALPRAGQAGKIGIRIVDVVITQPEVQRRVLTEIARGACAESDLALEPGTAQRPVDEMCAAFDSPVERPPHVQSAGSELRLVEVIGIGVGDNIGAGIQHEAAESGWCASNVAEEIDHRAFAGDSGWQVEAFA